MREELNRHRHKIHNKPNKKKRVKGDVEGFLEGFGFSRASDIKVPGLDKNKSKKNKKAKPLPLATSEGEGEALPASVPRHNERPTMAGPSSQDPYPPTTASDDPLSSDPILPDSSPSDTSDAIIKSWQTSNPPPPREPRNLARAILAMRSRPRKGPLLPPPKPVVRRAYSRGQVLYLPPGPSGAAAAAATTGGGEGKGGQVEVVEISGDGELVAVGYREGDVKVYTRER